MTKHKRATPTSQQTCVPFPAPGGPTNISLSPLSDAIATQSCERSFTRACGKQRSKVKTSIHKQRLASELDSDESAADQLLCQVLAAGKVANYV